MKLKGSELSYQIAVYIIVSLLLIVSVFPLLYVVCVAFSTQEEMVERGRMMPIQGKAFGVRISKCETSVL